MAKNVEEHLWKHTNSASIRHEGCWQFDAETARILCGHNEAIVAVVCTDAKHERAVKVVTKIGCVPLLDGTTGLNCAVKRRRRAAEGNHRIWPER